MRFLIEMYRATWLPTAALSAAILTVGSIVGGLDPQRAGMVATILVLVTPPIWWLVAKPHQAGGPGSGAAAGAICALLVFLIPIAAGIWFARVAGIATELGPLSAASSLIAASAPWALIIPFSAAIGALVRMIQRRLGKQTSPRAPEQSFALSVTTFIGRTWFVTALFVSPILWLEWAGWRAQGDLQGFFSPGWATVPAWALLVIPWLWWWLVGRKPMSGFWRGIGAGSLCASAILLVPTLYMVWMWFRYGSSSQGEGGMAFAVVLLSFPLIWIFGVPIGALMGAIAAFLQQRPARPSM